MEIPNLVPLRVLSIGWTVPVGADQTFLRGVVSYCKVNLEVAVLEALPILSAVEMEEEGSLAREDAEHMVMERVSVRRTVCRKNCHM